MKVTVQDPEPATGVPVVAPAAASRTRDVNVIAHRGGAGLAAENSLAAFEASWALGVRQLETDARVTSDGVILAFHDSTLDRTTSLRGPVCEMPYARLHGLPGITRMDDLLTAFPDAEFLIDVKEPRVVEPLSAVLRQTGAGPRVWVAGGWDPWLAAVVDRSPGARAALGWRALSTLMWAARVGVRPPRRLASPGGAAHVPWRLTGVPWLADPGMSRRVVSMSHDLGVLVRAWTINDPDHMRRLVADGVDGIITDRPDLAREALIAADSWAPMSARRVAG